MTRSPGNQAELQGDTSRQVVRLQVEAYRRMGPAARVELMVRMSDEVRQIALAGIQGRHPEYDASQARLALYRLLYGDELAQAAWPTEASARP